MTPVNVCDTVLDAVRWTSVVSTELGAVGGMIGGGVAVTRDFQTAIALAPAADTPGRTFPASGVTHSINANTEMQPMTVANQRTSK